MTPEQGPEYYHKDEVIDHLADALSDDAERENSIEDVDKNLALLREFTEDPLKQQALEIAIEKIAADPVLQQQGLTPALLKMWIYAPLDETGEAPYALEDQHFIESMARMPVETPEQAMHTLRELKTTHINLQSLGWTPQGFSEDRVNHYLSLYISQVNKLVKQVEAHGDEQLSREYRQFLSDMGLLIMNIRGQDGTAPAYMRPLSYPRHRRHLDYDDYRSVYYRFNLEEGTINRLIKEKDKNKKVSYAELQAYHDQGLLTDEYIRFVEAKWPVEKTIEWLSHFNMEEQIYARGSLRSHEAISAIDRGAAMDFVAALIKNGVTLNFRVSENGERNAYVFFYETRGNYGVPPEAVPALLGGWMALDLHPAHVTDFMKQGIAPEMFSVRVEANKPWFSASETSYAFFDEIDLEPMVDYLNGLGLEHSSEVTPSLVDEMMNSDVTKEELQAWEAQSGLDLSGLWRLYSRAGVPPDYVQAFEDAGYELSESNLMKIKTWHSMGFEPQAVRALEDSLPEGVAFTLDGTTIQKLQSMQSNPEEWAQYVAYLEAGVMSVETALKYHEQEADVDTVRRMCELGMGNSDWVYANFKAIPEEHHDIFDYPYEPVAITNYLVGVIIEFKNDPVKNVEFVETGLIYEEYASLLEQGYHPQLAYTAMVERPEYQDYPEYVALMNYPNVALCLDRFRALRMSADQILNYDYLFKSPAQFTLGDFDEIVIAEKRKGHLDPQVSAALDKYNISFPSRIPGDVLEGMIHGYEVVDENPKPKALVVLTQTDWNGAFGGDADMWSSLLEGYDVYIYEASSDDEFMNSVHAFGQESGGIDLMVVGAHGRKAGFSFSSLKQGEVAGFDVRDKKELRTTRDYFNEDAQVVLFSCSTGRGAWNIASVISRSLGGLPVTAPNKPTGIIGFRFDEEGMVTGADYADPDSEREIRSGLRR